MSHDRGCSCGREPYEYLDCEQKYCIKKPITATNKEELVINGFKTEELYELRDYDGGDGWNNQPSGYLTRSRDVAKAWCKLTNGNSYTLMQGIVINSLNDIKSGSARDAIKKQKALAKLTTEERKLLGL